MGIIPNSSKDIKPMRHTGRKLGKAGAVALTALVLSTLVGAGVSGIIDHKAPARKWSNPENLFTYVASEMPENTETSEEEILYTGPYRAVTVESTVDLSQDESILSKNVVLIDVDNEAIIAQKDAFERISPASMTKVLTLLVAVEHLKESDMDNPVTITVPMCDYILKNDCSAAGYYAGDTPSVRDLLFSLILPSGADGALGLAEYISGSQEAFVELMNDKLAELELSDSAHFTNCIGLYDEDHYCTVYDIAVIMQTAMENELCREILCTRTYTTAPVTSSEDGYALSNRFLRKIEEQKFGGSALGAKTGYVKESGSCAVSSEKANDGSYYILVTAGAEGSENCLKDHDNIYSLYTPAGIAENASLPVEETPSETPAEGAEPAAE